MNEGNVKSAEVMTAKMIEDFIEAMRKKNRGESSLDNYNRSEERRVGKEC